MHDRSQFAVQVKVRTAYRGGGDPHYCVVGLPDPRVFHLVHPDVLFSVLDDRFHLPSSHSGKELSQPKRAARVASQWGSGDLVLIVKAPDQIKQGFL